MVLKIITDFSNFSDLMPKIREYKYSYIFTNNALYISDVNNGKKFKQNIKYLFGGDNCFMTEIDETNLNKEPDRVKDWVKNQLVQADLIRYENDNQNKLNALWKALDQVESELFTD